MYLYTKKIYIQLRMDGTVYIYIFVKMVEELTKNEKKPSFYQYPMF